MSVEVQLPVMGAQGAKLEEPAAGNNNNHNVAAMSLELSSTTMSDGGAPGLSPHRRSSYVRQLKACILQKRQKVEPSTEGISIISPSTEVEDESSSYHDAGLGGMHHHNISTSINNMHHHQHHHNMSSSINQQQVHHHQVTVAKQSNIKPTAAAPFFAWPIVTEGTTALAAEAAAAPGRARGPCRQFWKAGEYDGQPSITTQQSGMTENSQNLQTSCQCPPEGLSVGCNMTFILVFISHITSSRINTGELDLKRIYTSDTSEES